MANRVSAANRETRLDRTTDLWNGNTRFVLAPTPAVDQGSSITGGMQRIGRFQLLDRLGEGGMGIVFAAFDAENESIVAVKLIHPERQADPKSLMRFQKEIKWTQRLDHPGFARAIDAGISDGRMYLALEYVPGKDLSQILTHHNGQLRISDACEIVRRTAEVIQAAFQHKRQMIHRDLKPANIMLTTDGSIKVLDLGLALSAVAGESTIAGTVAGRPIGTLDFMSPEQCRDSHFIDIRSDIYSLGATLYKLLTGQAPFDLMRISGSSVPLRQLEQIRSITSDDPPEITTLRPEIPPELAALIHQCLSRDPSHRPATPGLLAEALAPFAITADLGRLAPAQATLPDFSTAVRELKQRRRNRKLKTFVAVCLLLILLFGSGITYYATNYGELVINVLDEDTTVSVSKGGKVIEVIDTRKKRSVRLRADEYSISIDGSEQDSLTINTDKVTIHRGKSAIAIIQLKKSHDEPIPAMAGSKPASAELLADWRFASFGRNQSVQDGQMLRSFEGDAKLCDGSGNNRSAITYLHPRYEYYTVDASHGPGDSDGRAVRMGFKSGSLWCEEGTKPLGHGDYFSVWCRFRMDPAPLKEDQILIGRPGDWDLRIRQDGHLVAVCGEAQMQIEKREYGDHVPPLLTEWPEQWIDAALTVERNPEKENSYTFSVFLDGKLWFRRHDVARKQIDSRLHIGCLQAKENVFEGLMDRIRIWNGIVDPEEIRTMSVAGGKEIAMPFVIMASAVSPNSNKVAVGGDNETIEILNLSDLKPESRLTGHNGIVHSLAYSSDGKLLASGSEDTTAKLWNASSGTHILTLEGHRSSVFCVAFSADSALLATTGGDSNIRIWNTTDGKLQTELSEHSGWVWSAAFSPDGKWMASCSYPNEVLLWEVPSFQLVASLDGHEAWVRCAAFSPDSRTLYTGSGDQTFCVWDVEKQELRARIDAAAHVVQSIDVSSDGRYVAIGGFDHRVRIWDSATLEEQQLCGRHPRRVQIVRFLSNKNELMSGCEGGILRHWLLDQKFKVPE